MLVSEMIQEVRDHGFDDLTEVRILSFLNDTYYDLCAREPWPFMEAQATLTVGATGAVSSPTPATTQSVLSIFNSTLGGRLHPRRLDELTDAFGRDMAVASTGQYYYFVGSTVYIYPVDRTNVLKMNYIMTPTALTSSPDSTPILPGHIHRLLVTGALAKAAVMEDDPDLAAIYVNMFETRLSQARSALWMRQYDEPDTIEDVFGNDEAGWDYL